MAVYSSDANQLDLLGEGTSDAPTASGGMTQAELDDQLMRRRAQTISLQGQQTANANAGYNSGRVQMDPNAIDPATGRPYVTGGRPDGGSFTSGILPTLSAISRDPITAGILMAPYGVLGAGAAMGGLASGGAGTLVGSSPIAGTAAQTAPGIAAANAGAHAGGQAALNSAANAASGVIVDSGAAALPAAAGSAIPAAAGTAAAAGGSSWAPWAIGGGLAAANTIGGLAGGNDKKMPNMPATPTGANRPEAALGGGGQVDTSGGGAAGPYVQNTGNAGALNAAIMGGSRAPAISPATLAASPGAAQRQPFGASQVPAGAATPVARAPGTAPLAQGISPNPGASSPTSGFASGAGSAGISAVDQALTNFRPAPAAPPTGAMATAPGQVQMGALPGREAISALPGTVGQGKLPGAVQMGALPGATDRQLQTSALDRVLGYDANTSSKAEAQLADAQQMNLSNSLALSHVRGGPGAQAQASRMAQAEGAATMSQGARDLATLRAQEEDTAKQRELDALGLGGKLTGDIRTGDVSERQQNVGALETALNAGATQRGQTVQAITADQAARAQQRGQTINSLDNSLNAGVTQRGQEQQALEAALNAGVTQRGQNVDLTVAERNAGVTERGQTTQANTAASQQQLDAILGRGTLAGTERTASASERNTNVNAAVQMESISQARDAVATSAATDAQKTAATLAIEQARLGYELTPDQKMAVATVAAMSNDPSTFEVVLKGVQSGVDTALNLKRGGL